MGAQLSSVSNYSGKLLLKTRYHISVLLISVKMKQETRRGIHVKSISFLWDEDIMPKIKTYLQAKKFETSPKDLADYMNNEILPGNVFVSW